MRLSIAGDSFARVAPSDLAIDKEWSEDIPRGLKQAFKYKFKNNLSYIQAHCIMQLTGKAGQELRALTGSSFKGDQDALVISNTGKFHCETR